MILQSFDTSSTFMLITADFLAQQVFVPTAADFLARSTVSCPTRVKTFLTTLPLNPIPMGFQRLYSPRSTPGSTGVLVNGPHNAKSRVKPFLTNLSFNPISMGSQRLFLPGSPPGNTIVLVDGQHNANSLFQLGKLRAIRQSSHFSIFAVN